MYSCDIKRWLSLLFHFWQIFEQTLERLHLSRLKS